MNTVSIKSNVTDWIFHGLYLTFFISLIFSFRAISSLSVAAILLFGIVSDPGGLATLFKKQLFPFFLLSCVLLFVFQVAAMFYTTDIENGWSNIRIKSGLIIVPFAVYLSSYLNKVSVNKLLFQYCLLLVTAGLYCTIIAFFNFQNTGIASHFFYHQLVSPFEQHAVYVSILVMIGLIFLFENWRENQKFGTWVPLGVALFLSVFLFLLSSKLVISFYIFYLVLFFLNLLKKRMANRISIAAFIFFLIGASLAFSTKNPVSRRFSEIVNGGINIINRDTFKQSDYFNGLQFRLLQWRFVPEILTEKKRWWTGVSPGDGQRLLNEKYLEKNMYAGEVSSGDRGYLVYNTHNQFLQTLLQSGITGLILLLAMCALLTAIAWQHKDRMLTSVVLLLLLWLFTEAAFETQHGIMIFFFFPVLLEAGSQHRLGTKGQPFER